MCSGRSASSATSQGMGGGSPGGGHKVLHAPAVGGGGPLPSDVPAAPRPPPQLCRPAPCRKVAAGPGHRPEGWGPTLSQDRAQKRGVSLPRPSLFALLRGGGAVERGESCEGEGTVTGWVGRAIRKGTAGQAAGRTCRDPPTETERNSETEKPGGLGRGGGGGASREREDERGGAG